MDAIKDLKLPESKTKIISYIDKNAEISEASRIALNKLENRTYGSKDEICENVRIVCDLEIRDALSEMSYPATKEGILEHVKMRESSEFVIKSLEDLPDGFTYNSISDICKEI